MTDTITAADALFLIGPRCDPADHAHWQSFERARGWPAGGDTACEPIDRRANSGNSCTAAMAAREHWRGAEYRAAWRCWGWQRPRICNSPPVTCSEGA